MKERDFCVIEVACRKIFLTQMPRLYTSPITGVGKLFVRRAAFDKKAAAAGRTLSLQKGSLLGVE